MCAMQTRWKQPFYEETEPIKLREPLAEFLGAINKDEEFIFTYADVVKMAGHSCPSVSGAYKITQKALKALYGNETPRRGEISVKILGDVDHGANGPMSQVISLITGAAPETGFSGLGQRFGRKNKLTFDGKNEEANTFVFTRDDNGKSVKVIYHPQRIPQAREDLSGLLAKCVVGTASKKERQKFQEIWQSGVKAVLCEEVEGLFEVKETE